jgi:hypothetical protein
MRWAKHVARVGEKKISYKFLVGKTEGKRSLGRPWRAWKDNIKINLKNVGWNVVE